MKIEDEHHLMLFLDVGADEVLEPSGWGRAHRLSLQVCYEGYRGPSDSGDSVLRSCVADWASELVVVKAALQGKLHLLS